MVIHKDQSSDFLQRLGPLGLALKLKRTSEQMADQGRLLYQNLGIDLEPHLYGLLLLLQRFDHLSITEAADHLGLSHPTVISMARKAESRGWLTSSTDDRDRRRRILALSAQSRDQWPLLEAVWQEFREVLFELLESTTGDLLDQLSQLEHHLSERGLEDRVQSRVDQKSKPPRRPSKSPTFTVRIRKTQAKDRASVLHIAQELVRSGDTYAYDSDISDDRLWHYWKPDQNGQGFVAEADGLVVGQFVIRRNQAGGGDHVGNASYAVRADQRGLGLGRKMGEASLELATEMGFKSLQFNSVVSTNRPALRLWKSLGFRIVGTIPQGFRLPEGRWADLHILFRELVPDRGSGAVSIRSL